MTTRLAVLALLFSSLSCMAEQVHLKCVGESISGGPQVESMITVDTAANYMRVNGEALPLSVTNETYSSVIRDSRAFMTVNRIDRATGTFVVTTMYEGKPVKSRSSQCEKTELPKPRF